jgi:RNA polymerase sigma-70 factor (sigma-E family)
MMSVDDGGDTLTFDDFFRDEYPRLVPVLQALTGDRDLAEDLAQESFAKAQRDWDRIAAYDRPGAWVRRVALNATSNTRRRQGRERAALARLGGGDVVLELAGGDDELWEFVRSLPEQQRWAVVLFYVEDRSVADTAAVLGCSDGTVKTHLARARETLARQLRRRGEEVAG